MTNPPLFTVVVPACDVAPFIVDAADSLTGQNCGDFECLLVVEESADRTEELCREIAAGDRRFRVLIRPRSGSPSAARNVGMNAAQGEYIVFLDGDDWLEPDALANLRSAIISGGRPDVIHGAAREVAEGADHRAFVVRKIFNGAPWDDGRIFSGEEMILQMAKCRRRPCPAAWLNVCRRDFLLGSGLMFRPGLRFECEEWTPRVFFHARTAAVMDQVFYNRRRRAGDTAAMRRRPDPESAARIVKSLLEFHAANHFSPELSRAWGKDVLSFFFRFFFHPGRIRGHSRSLRRRALRMVLADPEPFRRLVRYASLSKRAAAPLVLLGRRMLWPAELFFRVIYYPLTVWKGEEER